MAPNGLVWIISPNEPKKSVLGLQSDMRHFTARTADMVNAHLGFEPSARSRSSSTSLKYSRVPREKYVNLKESIASFQGVLDGKYNDLSEQSFYMVGGIEEVIARSEKIAKESAT